MADNLTALANTGTGTDVLATDEIGGVHFPRSKLVHGADGVNDGDVSTDNPLPVADGSLAAVIALLNEMCIRMSDVADSVGNLSPDAAGRLRVTADVVATHAVTLASLATVTTVTTVTSLTNMASVGGYAANQQIIAQTQMAELQLRQNIVIS
jgi:hypothetical protein